MGTSILVVCRERDHEPRPAARFEHTINGWDLFRVPRGVSNTMVETADGTVIGPNEALFGEGAPTTGSRSVKYRVKCRLCHFDWQRHKSVVDPYLDKLELAGVASIDLAAFARTLEKPGPPR
jgi:hypothetical protein